MQFVTKLKLFFFNFFLEKTDNSTCVALSSVGPKVSLTLELVIDFPYSCAFPAGINLLKVNNRSTRTRCEICSKLTIKTPERRYWRRFGVSIFNFEHISHLVLVFLLLTLNR